MIPRRVPPEPSSKMLLFEFLHAERAAIPAKIVEPLLDLLCPSRIGGAVQIS
jgi:hypothetical protein